MHCRDAKEWLCVQRDDNLAEADASALQAHLTHCAACRAFKQHIEQMDGLFIQPVAAPLIKSSLSTDQIMRAIQQQKRVTQQLEKIRAQQQSRVARLRHTIAAPVAIILFALSSVPLLLFAIAIIQTDFALKALASLNGVINLFIILAQYLQAGLTLAARDNWLLSGVAFAVVVMMGMWLRLMRHPQEA
jgi:anti-sigma factor RsiW